MENTNTAIGADSESDQKKKVDSNTIFSIDLGQFGRIQMRILGLAILVAIFSSWSGNEFLFTTARIPTRCMIPECDDYEPDWSPYWLANAIPATSATTFDYCQRFANTSTSPVMRQVESDTCPSTLFDRNCLQPCEQHVYQNTHSVAYDFGLACDEWRRSLIGTFSTFGSLTALPITGFMSDLTGRRIVLAFSAFNTAWLGIVRYWANTYLGFVLSQYFEATFGSGTFSSAYILLTELMGPKYRVACGALMNSCFAFGQVTMGLIAWVVPNWRYLTLTLYIPQLASIFYYWLITESPLWYMTKGRLDDVETVLKKIAKTNGTKLSDQTLQALRENALEEARKKALEKERNFKDPWLIVQVFRHKRILLRVIISPLWWFTTTFIYNGLSINAVNMSGNRYLNYMAAAVVEIPGTWSAFFLMQRIGRRPVLIVAYWICAACQIVYIFLPDNMYIMSLIVYLIGKLAIAAVMTTIYVYTVELYPTSHRHTLFAYSSMLGSVGSILAPLTPAVAMQWFVELPFALFAGMALLSGALVFATPETLGTKLPDTFKEASQIGLKPNN